MKENVAICAIAMLLLVGVASAAPALSYNLYQRDSDYRVIDGAWGKFRTDYSEFSFNGHKLQPNTEYTLINYDDRFCPTIITEDYVGCIAVDCISDSVESSRSGNLKISGTLGTIDYRRVWLVPSSDLDCEAGKMLGWNPTEYLL